MSQFVQETRQVKPRLRSATRNVKGQDFAVDIKQSTFLAIRHWQSRWSERYIHQKQLTLGHAKFLAKIRDWKIRACAARHEFCNQTFPIEPINWNGTDINSSQQGGLLAKIRDWKKWSCGWLSNQTSTNVRRSWERHIHSETSVPQVFSFAG
jgi:hypothetical protein